MISIYSPRIYTNSAKLALDSGWISSQGEYISLATNKLKEILKIPYAILMNNGTSSTHMLIKAIKYKYPQINKIYVPNNVFIAVWNTVLYEYPKDGMELLEMNPNTLNMRTDEEYILSIDKNSAVIIVHNIGNIINVPRLKRLRPDLIFVEDNCEGLFGKYEGIYSGTSEASLCSAVSFFANKTITSGEGGAFFTHDKDLYDFIYKTIHHGATNVKYVYDVLGYNYRMTNIQAALLYDQLINLDKIREDKTRVFNRYRLQLNNSVVIPESEINTVPSEWMFVCGIPNIIYSELEKHMIQNGIDIRPFFYDISVHKHLEHILGKQMDTNVTYFMIPSSPDLRDDQIDYVCKNILFFIKNYSRLS
jgi:perosamine synthetase